MKLSSCNSLNVLMWVPHLTTYLWSAGNEVMEKKMESAIMDYTGTTKDPFLHS